jgi:putative membrane protein
MKKERILSEDSIVTIEDKIRSVEKMTSGEIVVAVTPASSRYLDIGISVSSFASVLASYLCVKLIPLSGFDKLSFLFNSYLPETMFGMFLIFFFVFNLLFFIFPSLKYLFLSKGRKEAEIHKKAEQIFYQNHLDRTVDKTGILILLSLLERRIYILADEGIVSRIGIEGLKTYARDAAKNIKKNNAERGIIETIESFEKILKDEFPPRKNNPNELSDRVIFQ